MCLPERTLGYLVARRETSCAFLEEEQVYLQLWDRGCDGEDAGFVSSRCLWNRDSEYALHVLLPLPRKTRSGDGHVSICLCVSHISKVRE